MLAGSEPSKREKRFQLRLNILVVVVLMFILVAWLVAGSLALGWFLIASSVVLIVVIVKKSALTYVYLLLVVMMLLPKTRNLPGLATARMDEFLVFPLLIAVLALYGRQKGRVLRDIPKVFAWTFGAYILSTFISLLVDSFYSSNIAQLKIIASLLQLAAVFFLVYYALLLEPDRFAETIKVLFALAAFVMVIGIAQRFNVAGVSEILRTYYARDSLSYMGTSRITSVFEGNPTHLGGFIIVTNSMLLAWFLWKQRAANGLIAIAMLSISFYALFLNTAKWAIVVQLGLIVFFAFSRKMGTSRKLLLLAILVAVVYVGLLTYPTAMSRLATFDDSYMGRSRAYSEAATVFNSELKNALFGYGFSQRWIAEGQFSHELYRKGILGLLGFSIFVFGQVVYILRRSNVVNKDDQEAFVYWGGLGMWLSLLLLAIPYAIIEHDRVREWIIVWLAVVYAFLHMRRLNSQSKQGVP